MLDFGLFSFFYRLCNNTMVLLLKWLLVSKEAYFEE